MDESPHQNVNDIKIGRIICTMWHRTGNKKHPLIKLLGQFNENSMWDLQIKKSKRGDKQQYDKKQSK